jgi:hypothetical protein
MTNCVQCGEFEKGKEMILERVRETLKRIDKNYLEEGIMLKHLREEFDWVKI